MGGLRNVYGFAVFHVESEVVGHCRVEMNQRIVALGCGKQRIHCVNRVERSFPTLCALRLQNPCEHSVLCGFVVGRKSAHGFESSHLCRNLITVPIRKSIERIEIHAFVLVAHRVFENTLDCGHGFFVVSCGFKHESCLGFGFDV